MATEWTDSTGQPLLHCVLANKDVSTRVALANRVLDDGADASALTSDGRTTAHVLLEQKRHDPPAEAPLLERLFDEGSDVNHVVTTGQIGTPLHSLAKQFQFTDEFFAPYYDVFFARPDLDLTKPTFGSPVIWIFRSWWDRRSNLVRRADHYLLTVVGIHPNHV
ncbi:hypothetical protein [Saccharopolyspora tripterygii]